MGDAPSLEGAANLCCNDRKIPVSPHYQVLAECIVARRLALVYGKTAAETNCAIAVRGKI